MKRDGKHWRKKTFSPLIILRLWSYQPERQQSGSGPVKVWFPTHGEPDGDEPQPFSSAPTMSWVSCIPTRYLSEQWLQTVQDVGKQTDVLKGF